MTKWSHEDPITGERIQSLAEVSVLTRSILEFHTSLAGSGMREAVVFRGSHTQLEPDENALARLRGRRTIFVYSHLLESFIARVLPRLEHRFVLISHNSDHGVDQRFRPALDDSRIVHWFAQNALIRHPKLTALPIGVANAQWPHGNLDELLGAATAARPTKRAVVYVNFDVRTNPAVRLPLLQRLAGLPAVWHAPPKPFASYLADMARCRWVLSPPGNGVDCHRTWEALYLGVTPIVLRTEHGASLHDGQRIIQLNDLTVLDPASLDRAEQACATDALAVSRLKMSYWREQIAQKIAVA